MLISLFKHFFTLGWLSFGGPIAHIGYFHQKFVQELQWLSQEQFGKIVALSQFLPGPGSSQVGFAVGYQKAGVLGAITAFIAFTAPSVIIMIALAQLSYQLVDEPYFYGITHGLKLLAVVVVADATWSMFNSFCKQRITQAIAVFTAVTLLIAPSMFTQLALLIIAAAVGVKLLTQHNLDDTPAKVELSWWPLVLFIGCLGLFLVLHHQNVYWQMASDFYQAGSMVFGGGHVVLPLLQNLIADQLPTDTFLTGYAAAQAVPGPMFTLATYLGFHLSPQTPYLGALIATAAVFLPGFLLMLTFLKHWQKLANMPKLAGAMQGLNAAVVGLLFSALYMPVFSAGVITPKDLALVVVGFYLLKQHKVPIVWLVLGFSFAGIITS